MPEESDTFAFDKEVGLFLATCRTASVATVGEAGEPHAANVQYAQDEAMRLIWVSSGDSQHSRDLCAKPRAAVTVYGHDDQASNIHGVQMRGTVETIGDESQWNAVWEAYTAKFAFVAAMPQLREIVEQQAFYRFSPTWLRWIDNRRGFGWKREKQIGSST
jgi:uncharacterized protein YhbP (UPF0306 family)